MYDVFRQGRGQGQELIPFKYRLSNEAIEQLAAEKDIEKISAELESIGYRHGAEIPQMEFDIRYKAVIF